MGATIIGVLLQTNQAADQAAAVTMLGGLTDAQKINLIDGFAAAITADQAIANPAIITQATQDMLIDGYTATLNAAALLKMPGDTVRKTLRDGFEASIKLPTYATDKTKMYCPAYPKEEIKLGVMGPLVAEAEGGFHLHESQPMAGSKGFQFCWTSFHENHKLANTYGGNGLFNINKEVITERTPIWNKDGSLEMLSLGMEADYLQYGSDFVNLIIDVRKALLEDTVLVGDRDSKTDGDIFPSGIPFVFWEQYVDLLDHLVSKATYAGVVVLATVTVLMVAMLAETADKGLPTLIAASLHGATLVVLMCMVTMIEIYGFMGVMEIKLNAIPQVTLIMAIGMTVEFTAHILLAYLNSPDPATSPGWSFASRKARTNVSLSKMCVPSIHGALTTFLGIVMLANADAEFIVLYYFMLYFLLVVFGIINGIFVLPALLCLIGPVAVCTETENNSTTKTAVPKVIITTAKIVPATSTADAVVTGPALPALES